MTKTVLSSLNEQAGTEIFDASNSFLLKQESKKVKGWLGIFTFLTIKAMWRVAQKLINLVDLSLTVSCSAMMSMNGIPFPT